MANEKIDTTQNIITPPTGDREKEKRLLEALKAIPDEEIIRLWEEFDEEERIREKEEAKRKFETLWDVDWSTFEFERTKRIVKRKWKTFDLNTNLWEKGLMNEAFWVMKSSDITKILPILWEIFGDDIMTKLHEYLTGWWDCDFLITKETL